MTVKFIKPSIYGESVPDCCGADMLFLPDHGCRSGERWTIDVESLPDLRCPYDWNTMDYFDEADYDDDNGEPPDSEWIHASAPLLIEKDQYFVPPEETSEIGYIDLGEQLGWMYYRSNANPDNVSPPSYRSGLRRRLHSHRYHDTNFVHGMSSHMSRFQIRPGDYYILNESMVNQLPLLEGVEEVVFTWKNTGYSDIHPLWLIRSLA